MVDEEAYEASKQQMLFESEMKVLNQKINLIYDVLFKKIHENYEESFLKALFSLSKNPIINFKQRQKALHQATWRAYFLIFIAANLNLTHLVTWERPLTSVYRIPCFSLASAKQRSIVSFRLS